MNFKVSDEVSALGISVAFLSITSIDDSYLSRSLKNEIGNYNKLCAENNTFINIENEANIIAYQELHTKISVTENSLTALPEMHNQNTDET